MPLPAGSGLTALIRASDRLNKTVTDISGESGALSLKLSKPLSALVGKSTALNLLTISTMGSIALYKNQFTPYFNYLDNKIVEMRAEFISITILYESEEVEKSICQFEDLYFKTLAEISSIHSVKRIGYRKLKIKLERVNYMILKQANFVGQLHMRLLHELATKSAQNGSPTKTIPNT